VATLRLFAAAREAAGTGRTTISGSTVQEVIDTAIADFGPEFARVVGSSRIWLNGEQAEPTDAVGDIDEVAVLPPVSGGC
jgi:molybdopterin synthase sulfur carrier subunit